MLTRERSRRGDGVHKSLSADARARACRPAHTTRQYGTDEDGGAQAAAELSVSAVALRHTGHPDLRSARSGMGPVAQLVFKTSAVV
jgi:hypothetical protein